jgi:transcriptional regulator with XRE-family HTH domain
MPKILNPRTSAQDILQVSQVMKISGTELAGILGVSSQEVSDWMNGGELSIRKAYQLSLLAEVADIFVESRVDISQQILHRKVGTGKSLIDAFRDGSNLVQVAGQLISTLNREVKQRKLMSERLSDRLKVKLPVDVFGLAHLNENT